tara:strand:- start:611 stop:1300 length:690 start_codon:yes stop_codon:yes gene_type:complete
MKDFLAGILRITSTAFTILILIGGYYFYNTFIHKDYENVNISQKNEMQYLRCDYPNSINTPKGNEDWKNKIDIRYDLFSIDLKKDTLKDNSVKAYFLGFTNGESVKTTISVSPTQICFWGRTDNRFDDYCVSRKDLSIFGSKKSRESKFEIYYDEKGPDFIHHYPRLNDDGSWDITGFPDGPEGQCSFIDKEYYEAEAEEVKREYDKMIEDQNRVKEEELKAKTKDNII